MPRLVCPWRDPPIFHVDFDDSSLEEADDRVVVIPKSDFSFDGRAGSTQRVVLAEGIDSSAWRSGVLITRLHSKNLWRTAGGLPTAAIARVEVKAVYLDPDNPDVSFLDEHSTLSSPISDSTSAPGLDVVTLGWFAGAFYRVALLFIQGATQAGGAQTLSISVELVGRRA